MEKLWFWGFFCMLSGSRIYVCFFGRSKFHLWGMFCDDGCINFLPSFLLDFVYFNNSGLRMISSAGIF